jgi:hypothetical protein
VKEKAHTIVQEIQDVLGNFHRAEIDLAPLLPAKTKGRPNREDIGEIEVAELARLTNTEIRKITNNKVSFDCECTHWISTDYLVAGHSMYSWRRNTIRSN